MSRKRTDRQKEKDEEGLKAFIGQLITSKENKFKIENCLTDNGDGTFEIDVEKLKAERDRVYK